MRRGRNRHAFPVTNLQSRSISHACSVTLFELCRLAQCAELPCDESLQDFVSAVGLRARLGDPLVLAALENLHLALTAGGAIQLAHFFRYLPRHVGVELALHD